MPDLRDNASLLEGYRRGESRALEAVFRDYAPTVTAFLRKGVTERAGAGDIFLRGVDNLADVEDLLQETFVRAFSETARRNFDGRAPFKSYLLAIAKNLRIDRHRRAAPVLVEEGAPTVLTQETISLELLEKELTGLVQTFEAQLEGTPKTLFHHYFVLGHSLRETAKKSGKSLMQVRYQVAKHKRSLKKYLISNGYLEN